MSSSIKSYNSLIYDSRPVKFGEYMSNKYNNIHRELYTDALNKAISTYIECSKDPVYGIKHKFSSIEEFKANVNIVEFKDTEYWMPSSVTWRTKIFPYKTISLQEAGETGVFNFKTQHSGQMSLAPWWNMYQKFEHKQVRNIQIGGEQINDFAITYLNYVEGYAKLSSKMTGKEIEVPFEYLDENCTIDDSMLLDKTFTYLRDKNRNL